MTSLYPANNNNQSYNQYGDPIPTIHATDASTDGQHVIIAKRRVVKVHLKQCLAIDVPIAAFHIHKQSGLLVVASGKVLYLFDLERLGFLQKYGRTNGSIHRENILDVKFDYTATRMVSAGEDKRIVIWNVKDVKSEKILEGHQGKVFQVEFTREGENIISCSDDGRVFVWEWRTGAILLSYLRHPAAVRSIAFFPDRPDKIVVGRSDGAIAIWDLTVRGIIDTIEPDPDWLRDGEEHSLVGWHGIHKHHSGAIMALAVSPNGRYMASAATDHTTKLWGVVSYMKDVDVVQAELREANQKSRQLDKYIDVLDEKYDVQIKMQEFVGLRVGEVPIPTGYHSDLLFTFRHDSTVLSVAFNPASDICITGSMDSTCRLWSCRRGDLLFQINVPAPVSSVISSMDSEEMYLVCQNRVLIFGYQASAKEEELPETWRISADAFYSGDNTRAKNTPDTRVYVDSDEEDLDQMDPEKLAAKKANMTISELKQLISHGLVLPSFLDTLLAQFPDVDAERLIYLMKKYKLHPRQLLQLLVNSKYHPRDILMALSGKVDTGKLYELALSGNPISSLMAKLGYKPYDENNDKNAQIFLHYRDFAPELYMERPPKPGFNDKVRGTTPFSPFGQEARRNSYDTDEYRRQSLRDQLYYTGAQGERYRGELQGPKYQRHTPTGDLLHFIPSIQLKLLKDLQAHREVKPIFLRQILMETPKQPNFSPEYKIRDTTPWVPGRGPVSREGVRFNEAIPASRHGPIMPLNSYAMQLLQEKRRTGPAPVPLHGKGEIQGTSSKTIFNPDRYLKTMGMNVKWAMPSQRRGTNNNNGTFYGGQGRGQVEIGGVSGNGLMIGNPRQGGPLVNRIGARGNMIQGHVYTQPIVIKHSNRSMEFNQQFIAGHGMQLKEATVDRATFFRGY